MMTETIQFDETFFCTELAQRCDEPIMGSAAEATVWLALEVPQPWGNKAIAESDLPAAVKAQLEGWQRTIPGARVQFIKQESGFVGDGIHFFVGLADDASPALYRFLLADYTDLLDFDLPALVAQAARFDAHRHAAPIFLVCTNGKRDRCCAKWGLPVYRAMADYTPGQVWQTTHTGGHRFAATLVCLPEGIGYGWVEPQDAAPLIEAHRNRLLYRIDQYRGCSAYPGVVQAAETLLRAESGILDLAAFRLHRSTSLAADRWQVEFARSDGAEIYTVQVAAAAVTLPNPHSCGKSALEPIVRYTRITPPATSRVL